MNRQDPDASLWLEATSGTEEAFVVIFDRYRERVFRAAFRRTGNVGDAEEIVAIVFLEAWRLRRKVRIVDGSLLPWLLAVTGNVTSNLTRSQRRYQRMLIQLPPPSDASDHAPETDDRIDQAHLSSKIDLALDVLAPRDRAVVQLCLVEELPLSHAAAVLQVPIGTVKSRLNRARKILKAELSSFEAPSASAPSKTSKGGLLDG